MDKKLFRSTSLDFYLIKIWKFVLITIQQRKEKNECMWLGALRTEMAVNCKENKTETR